MSQTNFVMILMISLGMILVASACGPGELREWTPNDHQQPASAVGPGQPGPDAPPPQVDPIITLYRIQCAGCHGPAGRGDGPERPPMAQPPDFTSAEWQGTVSDAQIRTSIVTGKGMMPAFGDKLLPAAIDRLVVFVRRIGGQPASAPPQQPAPTQQPAKAEQPPPPGGQPIPTEQPAPTAPTE